MTTECMKAGAIGGVPGSVETSGGSREGGGGARSPKRQCFL